MKKQIIILLLVLIMTISAIGWFMVVYGADDKNSQSVNIFFNPEMRKFVQTLNLLKESYYREVSDSQLIDEAINGMLKTLDPHSVYIYDENDIDIFSSQTTGEFGGIGFRVGSKDGAITVISPIENTPASKIGIRAGDIIIMIDSVSTEKMDVDEAVSKMRGAPGTNVKLTINRFGSVIDYDITRAVIKIKSIPYYGMVDDSTGYIKLVQFTDGIDKEFRTALDFLFKEKKAKKLILDLRQNPGGLLPQAISISNFFLPKGADIVSTKSKNKTMEMVFRATQPMYNGFFPLIVLVDDGSASASEIVAGAVQDWDRAIIMGDTTFGKGSVQSVIDFSKQNKQEKGILKFTTARYFTPSGRSIDKELIAFEKSGKDSSSYYSLGELKRNLLGGGGIIPDYVYQERFLKPSEIEVYRKQALITFVAEHLSKNKSEKKALTQVNSKVIDSYFEYLNNIGINAGEITSDSILLKDNISQLKYEFARQLGGDNLYYSEFVKNDALIQKAAELLKNSENVTSIHEKILLESSSKD
ncbi:MAG: S41 family peptidase [bacterium]|nr:S41 family peptidase [bacterium]